MDSSFSFIEIPSLESLESDSISVFSMARNTPSPTIKEEINYIIYNDFLIDEDQTEKPKVIKQEDKVFLSIMKEEPELATVKTEFVLSTIVKNEEEDTIFQNKSLTKNLTRQGRKRKTKETSSKPFPKYYNLNKDELSFFKRIKLVQSSSNISHVKDNMYMIEVSHYDKSIEFIRCFRSLLDNRMYFCSTDIFYPILRIKENINREVKNRVSSINYNVIENKNKSLTFLNLIGLCEIIRYRMNPNSATNSDILDIIKCNELVIELQKYL
jgi:hypothetical protein